MHQDNCKKLQVKHKLIAEHMGNLYNESDELNKIQPVRYKNTWLGDFRIIPSAKAHGFILKYVSRHH